MEEENKKKTTKATSSKKSASSKKASTAKKASSAKKTSTTKKTTAKSTQTRKPRVKKENQTLLENAKFETPVSELKISEAPAVESVAEIRVDKPQEFDYSSAEPLLVVKHLKQYFKFKHAASKYLKAVHDVSFTVYKGEVFGLVGESGCGKTTTGRDILKLYPITSGDIWFDGVRIAAGTRWNEKEIKFTNIRLKNALKDIDVQRSEEISSLSNEYSKEFDDTLNYHKLNKYLSSDEAKDDINFDRKKDYLSRYKAIVDKYEQRIDEHVSQAKAICDHERERIKLAKKDNRLANKHLAQKAMDKVEANYAEFNSSYNEKKTALEKEIEAKKASGADASDLQAQLDEINGKYKEYKRELKKASKSSLANSVQMIFQDPIASLNPRMTVRNIIAEGLMIQGVHDKKYINDEVSRVLKLVGLVPEHANRYPHEFSGGQRQRIGIARAIIMKPQLIVADEPVSALDVSIQAQVINLLNDLRKDLGLTLIFIAHNLSVVKYFCDRIAVMYYGKLVELATSEELFAHPLHPYTKSLLSAVPYPDPNVEASRQRVVYNPQQSHDYSQQKPTMRELEKGHFVLCNDEEEERYKLELQQEKSIYAK